MLELTDIDLKQTRFYQEVFTEGRQEEGVSLILRLLQRRCSEVASTVQEQIRRLPLTQLEALGEALLEFRGRADLDRWLVSLEKEAR